MRILEEFWYGNIEPTEYDTSSCKEYTHWQNRNGITPAVVIISRQRICAPLYWIPFAQSAPMPFPIRRRFWKRYAPPLRYGRKKPQRMQNAS